jgi:tetratricopeptide (TPR) repeat protein
MQRKPHILFLSAIILVALAAGAGCNKLRARDKLNKGVTAYKNAQFDVAIEDFKTAKELDPTLTNAQLYLATAYASQYIPGAPSPDNIRNGEQAVTEFKKILDEDPNNLSAIDGIGSILYNMGGTPYDEKKLNESKAYHEKHIELSPNDPEPYYWVGVIDWTIAYRGNRDARAEYNRKASPRRQIKENDPMPPAVVKKFAEQFGPLVDEGISKIQKAIELRPNYDDAMAYLNLLYRQKADMETSAEAREADLKKADELVDKVKAIKQKKANLQPTS